MIYSVFPFTIFATKNGIKLGDYELWWNGLRAWQVCALICSNT